MVSLSTTTPSLSNSTAKGAPEQWISSVVGVLGRGVIPTINAVLTA
jgi:hypothetical protein